MITLSRLTDVISDLNVSISDGPSIIWALFYKGVQLGVWVMKLQAWIVFFGFFAFLFIVVGVHLADYAYSKYSGKPLVLTSEWLRYDGFNHHP